MKKTVKKIITLLVVIGIAYLVLQHFFPDYANYTGNKSNNSYDDTGFTDDNPPPIPPSCQSKATDLENAIYGAENYDSSYIQKNRSSRVLASCLRDSGFSQDEINATIDQIRKNAEKLRRMDNQ